MFRYAFDSAGFDVLYASDNWYNRVIAARACVHWAEVAATAGAAVPRLMPRARVAVRMSLVMWGVSGLGWWMLSG